MKIIKDETGDLQAQLTMTIEPEDYLQKYKSELDKYRQKSHIKGFRKGKTPLSTIKKMYGKSVLVDVVNGVLQEQLSKYLSDEKLEILGDPIPGENQKLYDFDLKSSEDFEFIFDLGLAPQFELKGINEEDTYDQYVVEIGDERIEEELNNLQKRFGNPTQIEDGIEENDIILLEAIELEGKNPKEKGWETAFKLLVNRIGDESVKTQVMKSKKGDRVKFNIRTIEKDTSEEYVRKYLLNLDEGEEKEIGDSFEGMIKEVSRTVASDLDQDFFDKAFGKEKVSSEEEAKSEIKKELENYYSDQQNNLTFRNIMNKLVDLNPLELPESFLKRWLKIKNSELTEDQIENDYNDFALNLKWSLIRNKVVKSLDVEVSHEELKENVKLKLAKYLNPEQSKGLDMDAVVMNYLGNQEQLQKEYEEAMAQKMFSKLMEKVKMADRKVSIDEFTDLAKKLQEVA